MNKHLLIIIILSFLLLKIKGLEIESDRDFTQHIKAQIEARNEKVKFAFNALANNATPVTHEVLDGSIGALSIIAPFFLSIQFPLGYVLEFIVGCLEFSKSLHEKDDAINFGYSVAKGVKGVVDESTIKFDVSFAIDSLHGLKQVVTKFNKLKSETNDSRQLLYLANSIDMQFTSEIAKMINGYETALACIGIYTITANTHLLFLNQLILNSKNYGFDEKEKSYFYSTFIDTKQEYLDKIRDIDIWGQSQLEISAKNKKYTDEWNFRNQYYNFMKIYVYDICNYWFYLDPILFPNGVAIENAHVTLSNILGSAYDGIDQKSFIQINQLLDSKNALMYNGKLTGVYVRNNYCYNSPSGFEYYVPKYIKSRNYFIRKSMEMDNLELGDKNNDYKTSKNGDIKFFKLDNQISSITAYSANGLKNAKLYQFGLDINGTIKIGDTTWVNKIYTISYPNKVISTIIPTTINECKISCRDYYSQEKVKMIEGVTVGFVNKDINDENIIIQGITTMVDAQKYISINSNTPNVVINNYKSSIKFSKYTKATYQISFNSYNNNPIQFKLLLEYKLKSKSPLNLNIIYSNNALNQNSKTISFTLSTINENCSNYGDILSYVGFVKLESSKMNFITIENNGDEFLLNSLLFKQDL